MTELKRSNCDQTHCERKKTQKELKTLDCDKTKKNLIVRRRKN